MSESELDDLLGETGGPCNVMGMVNMFQEKIVGLFVAVKEEEKKVEEPAKVEEAAPADDEDADAKKKKKKKKKAAK